MRDEDKCAKDHDDCGGFARPSGIPSMARENKGPRIDASAVNFLLRQKWDELIDSVGLDGERVEKLLKYSEAIVSELEQFQILAIAKRRAMLAGNTHDGVRYVTLTQPPKCPECSHELKLLPRGLGVQCWHCDYTWSGEGQ